MESQIIKLRINILTVLMVLFLVSFLSLSTAQASEVHQKKIVLVSLNPQKLLIERLAGEWVQVEVLVGAGQNYHAYELSPRDYERFTRADLFLSIGIPFEKAPLKKLKENSTKLKVVSLDNGIRRREMSESEETSIKATSIKGANHDGHNDHAHGHHDHDLLDPHIWLSYRNQIIMTENAAHALSDILPNQKKQIAERATSITEELKKDFTNLQKKLAPYAHKTLYVYHPSFGYFTDEFSLHQKSIEVNGRSPSPKELKDFVESAKREKVKVIFFQPQFDKRSADIVAKAIAGEALPLDPMDQDVYHTLRIMGESVIKAYSIK